MAEQMTPAYASTFAEMIFFLMVLASDGSILPQGHVNCTTRTWLQQGTLGQSN